MPRSNTANTQPGRLGAERKLPVHTMRPPDFYIGRLSNLLLWDLRSTGRDVPGSQYYGRDHASLVARGGAIVEHYEAITKAGRPLLLDACVQAVNHRLAELALHTDVIPEDLVDTDTSGALVTDYSEPEVLSLNRLGTFDKVRAAIDRDPVGTYGAVDNFLAGRPFGEAIRSATKVVGYLEQHTRLDTERQILLGGAFDMALLAAGPAHV